MTTILLLIILLTAPPAYAAAPQHKGGVPTLNTNAQAKRPDAKRTDYDTRRINRAAASAYSQQQHSAAPSVAMPMLPQSGFQHRTVTPVVAPSASAEMQPMGSVNGTVISYFSNESARKGLTTANTMSGGISAGGLMSTGSRYASTAADEGGAAVSSATPNGPHRTNGYPDIPFPDEPVPVGDAVIPFVLLAFAYILLRRKQAAEN